MACRSSAAALLIAVGLSGCAEWDQAKRDVGALITVLQGGRNPLAKISPAPTGVTGATGAPAPVAMTAAERAKLNAEMLQEIFRVVYQRDPPDRAEFGNLVDSMNQGASFEGMYNGFVHSLDYRKLEIANVGASAEALKTFAAELALLEAELPTPTVFADREGDPAPAAAVEPKDAAAAASAPGEGVTVVEFAKGAGLPTPVPSPVVKPFAGPSSSPRAPDLQALSDQYAKLFVGASIYTLKRVMGDEALKVMDSKKEYPEKFALWYSKWAVRLCAYKVDFGLGPRNKEDEAFHFKWALSSGQDRLQWEVLNRLHRLLNEANRQKQ